MFLNSQISQKIYHFSSPFCFALILFFIEEILPEALHYPPGCTDYFLGLLLSFSEIFFASLLHLLFPGSSFLIYFLIAQWRNGGGSGCSGVEIYANNTLKKGEQEIFALRLHKSKNIFILSLYLTHSLGAELQVGNSFPLRNLKALLYSL